MCVFLLCIFLCVASNVHGLTKLENEIFEYWFSDFFRDQWLTHRQPIQESIKLHLQETYGKEGMNVYVRKMVDPHKLSDGFFVSDNIVKVLFKDLYLTQLPHWTFSYMGFGLRVHAIKVEAKVDNRLFIQADYQLFRNLSDITYNSADMDPYKTSPFNFQQVKSDGEVTIVAEGCILDGIVMVSLHDQSVKLGVDTIKLMNCTFSVEITTPRLGSPPVIAPYFSEEQGLTLELLLSKPIREELLPKLQGALFSYVNTSSIFGNHLPEIRQAQQNVFKQTYTYYTRVIRNINKVTLNENHGIEKIKDIFITWSDKNYQGELQEYKIALKDMTITGLDSAYSAQNGGPLRLMLKEKREWTAGFQDVRDTIRFSELQIKGTLEFGIDAASNQYAFYGEIQDITTCMSFDITNKTLILLEVYGWRNLDLHVPDIPLISARSLITGIIWNELPPLIERRLIRSFKDAFKVEDKKLKEEAKKTIEKGCGSNKKDSDNQTVVTVDMNDENNKDVQYEMNVIIENPDDDQLEVGAKLNVVNKDQDNSKKQMLYESMLNVVGGGNIEKLAAKNDGNKEANDLVVENDEADEGPEVILKRKKKDIKATDWDSSYNFEHDNACSSVDGKRISPYYCPYGTRNDTQLQVEYRLYRWGNLYQYILLDENAEPVDPRNKVDLANAPLKVITHGWKSSADDRSVALIKDAYLNTRYCNIIAVNWSVMADTCYCQAVVNVKIVGKSISRFLDAVNMRYGVGGGDMHLIGHSLGAHVVGIAAWRTSFSINRVTGLDPAFPIFEFPILYPPDERIDSACADFVDIIHTCGGLMGFVRPIGHLDFYPNSGMLIQPNCEGSLEPMSCSHARSYEYYVETIYTTKAYPSIKCDSWGAFLDGKCDNNHYIYMGDGADPHYIGKYYLFIY